MRDAYYVTTPIYYVNDVPHIGHAYATVVADTAARFQRLCGRPVLFLTGADEHGQKVEKAAREHGMEPQSYTDQMVAPFRKLWERLSISNDDFIRTTEERHIKVVQAIFQKLYDQGDIYKGAYEGWYCIHEETFYLENQLVDGKCPECGRPVEWLKEESYYFATSKYVPRLLETMEEDPFFVQPDTRWREVESYLRSGVTDVCVSRTTFKWGVPVPFDPDHVVYVWFDALINYVTGAGYLQDEAKFAQFWPADVHVIGKDIIKFHAVIWPSMLMALGVPVPRQVLATGWWTLGEQKISKSSGVVVEPNDLIDRYGADALRYFFLREIPLGEDGEFTENALVRRINYDLANDLGNLLHRTVPMMTKYFDGAVPAPESFGELEEALGAQATGAADVVRARMDRLDCRGALEAIWEVVKSANKFIDHAAPWVLAKEGRDAELASVMYTLADTIRIVVTLISPFLPATADKMWAQLGVGAPLSGQRLSDAATWGVLAPGSRLTAAEPLFPRIDIEKDGRRADQPASPDAQVSTDTRG